MARWIVILNLSFLALVVAVEALNKYSKEANQNFSKQESPFRMQKINVLWQKALKKFDSTDLAQLYEDLKQQDSDELLLKKLKADNSDKDGGKEAQIRRQLKLIIKKYNLSYDENTVPPPTETERTFFKDKKLNKLWKKVEKLDLTEQQLRIIKEELRDYEAKIEEYHQLLNELHHKDAKENARKEEIDNHITPHMDEDLEDTVVNVADMDEQLKVRHEELREEYKRISDKIHNATNGHGIREFDEERALQLWKLALKSDFDEQELETLKEELFHFQTRIKKLNFFQNQMESDIVRGKNMNELNEDTLTHQAHIVNRISELNQNVEMLHQKIERKILQRHSEL